MRDITTNSLPSISLLRTTVIVIKWSFFFYFRFWRCAANCGGGGAGRISGGRIAGAFTRGCGCDAGLDGGRRMPVVFGVCCLAGRRGRHRQTRGRNSRRGFCRAGLVTGRYITRIRTLNRSHNKHG